MGILEVLSDMPEILAIMFWPASFTKEEWEEFNFWRIALSFTVGFALGMIWLAFFFWAMGAKASLGW